MTLPIKTVTSVLKVSTNIIISITSHPIRLTAIVIMFVSNYKTTVVLYLCLPFERRETYYCFSLDFVCCFRFFCFCFFSAKLVQTITFLSFQIGQLYLVCGCMTIRRGVTYRNDLCLTFDLKVK